MKSIILFELTNFRWLGFFLAMLGVYLLSDGDYFGNPMVQAIGWGSACLSALFWVIMGVRDKDIPTAYAINMTRDEGFEKILCKDLWTKPESAKEKVFDLFDLEWYYSEGLG